MNHLNYIRIIILTTLFLVAPVSIFAQIDGHADEHQHPWELGGALGAVYSIKESHIAPGLHAHLLKNLGEEKRFGVGLGFETILDEHHHLNFGIPLNYNTMNGFVFTATPGVLFKRELEWEMDPSVHVEILYEFTFEHYHLGPMVEIALAANDYHFMLGFHVGFGW